MYRRPLTFPIAVGAILATTLLCLPGAIAQNPPGDDDTLPELRPRPGDPPANPPTNPAAKVPRDYNKMQASGVLATPQAIHGVSFSPDGRLLGGMAFQQVFLWDTSTGTAVRAISLPQGSFARAIAWSPDSRIVAVAGGGAAGSVFLYDAQTGTPLQSFGPRLFNGSIAFSPDGALIATGGMDRKVRLWSPETGQEVATLEGPEFGVTSVTFSNDGAVLYAIGGGTGRLRQAEGEGGDGGDAPMRPMMMGMTPGTYDSMTEFNSWTVADRTRRARTVLSDGTPHAIFLPHKMLLAVVGSHGIIRPAGGEGPRAQTVWPADTVRLWRVPPTPESAADPNGFLPNVLKNPTSRAQDKIGLAWSPDNKVGVIQNFIWDGGETPKPLPRGDMAQFNAFAFSPDGSFLAGGGPNGVQIWTIPAATAASAPAPGPNPAAEAGAPAGMPPADNRP